jgi:hypothetical protein
MLYTVPTVECPTTELKSAQYIDKEVLMQSLEFKYFDLNVRLVPLFKK